MFAWPVIEPLDNGFKSLFLLLVASNQTSQKLLCSKAQRLYL